MPSLGADMEYGVLVDWRVKPGDSVKCGDIIALVETEKGVIEVESFESGVVDSLLVQNGQKVPVGTTLAIIRDDGHAVEARPAPVPKVVEEKKEAASLGAPAPIAPPPEAHRSRVSPLAHRRRPAGYAPS